MGVDQLKECIRLIKEDPSSRRIFMSSWNPKDVKKMALPPCHISCQFYVEGGFLSCQMYQRSGDVGLGIPFNIASYALLTYLIAHVTGLTPGDFIHVIGDTHIYLNHVSSLKKQISRVPFPFPKLKIKRKVTDIDDFKFEDFELVDYFSHPSIKMDMSI
jgi:thymidylate synthase